MKIKILPIILIITFLMIFFIFYKGLKNSNIYIPENNIKKRDFSNFSEREFEEIVINDTNWDEICMMNYQDASVSFGSFYNNINYHLDEMAPFKKLTTKEFSLRLKPWITKEI